MKGFLKARRSQGHLLKRLFTPLWNIEIALDGQAEDKTINF